MSTHYQVVSFTVWYIYPLDDNFWPVVCPLLIFVYFWDCCIVVLSHRVIILCLCVFVYFFFVVAYVTGALLYLLVVPLCPVFYLFSPFEVVSRSLCGCESLMSCRVWESDLCEQAVIWGEGWTADLSQSLRKLMFIHYNVTLRQTSETLSD